MLKAIYTTLFALLLFVPARATDQADRKALLEHLNQSSAELLEAVGGLTEAQWNFKPAENVWSIAECTEHIALTEDFLREMVSNRLLSSPARTDGAAGPAVPDDKVLKMITDRSFKANAPEPVQPARRFKTPAEALQAFQSAREKTTALARTRDGLREHTAPHPAFKDEMDGYQWILYISGHAMRHTAQIEEVKADAKFPKKE